MLIGDFYYEIPTSIPELNATSFYFVAFCLIVFVLARSFKSILRPLVLLVASIFFLYTFGIYNLKIVLCFAAVGYVVPLLFDTIFFIDDIKRKILLLVSVGGIAIGLLTFKFNNNLIAPLGLSFYTLKIISYIVDAYKNEDVVEKNPLYYLDYVLFFPCITAGPINRAKEFFEEIKQRKDLDYKDIATGGFRLAIGLFEKMVFCDFVASVVSRSLTNIELSGLNVLLGIVLYSFQIYLDFDSYSNIALGVSRMLGFKLSENFKTPYLATSIKDFWNRWHISLSSWLRDYIYFPLGGSRKGELRQYLNVIVVFIVSAIWHGTGLNYLLWGLGHAFFRIIEDLINKKCKDKVKNKFVRFIIAIPSIALNFVIITGLWMLFKYGDLSEMLEVFKRASVSGVFNYEAIGLTINELKWLGVIIVVTIITDILRYFFDVFEFMGKNIFILRWAIYVILILVYLVFGVYGGSFEASDFIYRWF